MMKCKRHKCVRDAGRGTSGLCNTHWKHSHHGFMPAGPSRQRLKTLRAAGLSWEKIGRLAGLGHQTIYRLSRSKNEHVQVSTHDALMRIPVPVQPISGGARQVSALATSRRIQALMAVGYPQTLIANMLGVSRRSIARFLTHDTCSAETAAAVYKLFEKLELTQGPSRSAMKRARAKGWLPPLYWDDDTINDPTALPEVMPLYKRMPIDEFLDMIEDHRSIGHTDAEIAKSLGVALDWLHTRMRRNGIPYERTVA